MMIKILLLISMVSALLSANPSATPYADETTASEKPTTVSPENSQQEFFDNLLQEVQGGHTDHKLSPQETGTVLREPLQKRFEDIIAKSLEQILGKNDIEAGAFVDTPCSNHNVEIIQPKIEKTVVLKDEDIEAVGNTEIKKEEDVVDKEAKEENTMHHLLQKKDISSMDKAESTVGLKGEMNNMEDNHATTIENDAVSDRIVEDKHNFETDDPQTKDESSIDKPDPIVELMNRLKEQMQKASMKELSPVLETINNMTLLGRMDALTTTTTTTLPVELEEPEAPLGPVPCTCGVFLSGQFKKGSKDQPKGVPVLTQEMDMPFLNNVVGNRQCTNKCLELIIKHLPKSSEIICATTERDRVYKEKAYLFIKNWTDKWMATNLSAGREFCCKENLAYKCPMS